MNKSILVLNIYLFIDLYKNKIIFICHYVKH